MLSVGEVVGGFVIKGPLGRGGMSAVYRAWDPSAGREVALKLLDLGGGSEGLLRFKREAELAARVDGQGGVVRVHARGVHQGTPFLVLELVEGRDLAEELRAGPIDPARLARIVEEVARALARCHALGVVHRDIKPANVLLRAADDAPLLTDFGIARDLTGERLTLTGVMMGTPVYMAPEQALDSARAIDPRVDVYALGAILYHGLAGRPPEHVISRIGHELPPPSSFAQVDASLEAICLRAVAPEPEQRHPGAAALADDLARWRRGERAVVARRRLRAPVVVAAALATALLVIGAAGHASGGRALARAERLEAAALSELLVEPAAVASWSGGAAAFHDEARALAVGRAFLVGEARARADACVERLEACARLVDELASPADAPPRDARARAADALVTARRSGPAAAVARLGAEGTRDPLVLAVQARLRAEVSAPLDYARWCAAARDEPRAWSVARPRLLALVARACREAATSPGTVSAAEETVAEAAKLDPRLVEEAIEDAADAWRQRMLLATREPLSRESAALADLRRLLAAGEAAPGPRVRDAAFAVFVVLDARYEEELYALDPTRRRLARDRVLAWDQASFELAPDLAPPVEHMNRLTSFAKVEAARGLPLAFALTCVRRGIELDGGRSWDDLGRAVLAAGADDLDPLDPSGALRLCALTAEVMSRCGGKLDSATEPPMSSLDAVLKRKLVTGVQVVLAAPRADVSSRYRAELHVLVGEALADLVVTGAVPEGEREGAWRATLEHVQAFMQLTPHVADLLSVAAWLSDLAATQLGRSGAQRLELLDPIVESLRAAHAAAEADRRRGLGGFLAQADQHLFSAAVAADRVDVAFAACHESVAALPPASRWESRFNLFLSGLKDPASRDAFVREFRGVAAADVAFVVTAITWDLEAGRVEEARALFAAAREINPTHQAWSAVEAQLAAPR